MRTTVKGKLNVVSSLKHGDDYRMLITIDGGDMLRTIAYGEDIAKGFDIRTWDGRDVTAYTYGPRYHDTTLINAR